MNSILDLFLGDPVLDRRERVVRRDFGIKNIVAIMLVGFIGYSLMGEMKPISGKRKMKPGPPLSGGADRPAARRWRAFEVWGITLTLVGLFVVAVILFSPGKK